MKNWPSRRITLRGLQKINGALAIHGLCIFIEPLRLCCWYKENWHPIDASFAEKQSQMLRKKP